MLSLTLYQLLSNALTLREYKSTLYSRVAITILGLTGLILYNNLFIPVEGLNMVNILSILLSNI